MRLGTQASVSHWSRGHGCIAGREVLAAPRALANERASRIGPPGPQLQAVRDEAIVSRGSRVSQRRAITRAWSCSVDRNISSEPSGGPAHSGVMGVVVCGQADPWVVG